MGEEDGKSEAMENKDTTNQEDRTNPKTDGKTAKTNQERREKRRTHTKGQAQNGPSDEKARRNKQEGEKRRGGAKEGYPSPLKR